MSDSPTLHSLFYVMRKEEAPNQTVILKDTNAETLVRPSTLAYPLELSSFLLGPDLTKWLDQIYETPNYIIQTIPVFPYKFKLDILDYDTKAVDTWFDGVPRLRAGTLSLLSDVTFISLFGIHHEQQIERAVETYEAIFSGGNDTQFPFGSSVHQVNNEVHFVDLIGTELAHRLTKTVILQVQIWWLYRITIYTY